MSMKQTGEQIRTQDNRCTEHPLFLVQQKIRIWGMDSDYSDEYVWIDHSNEGIEADESQAALLEEGKPVGGKSTYWNRVYFKDTWQFVTACFTEQACEEYIAANGHNLNEPRIYAASLYRNPEMIAVREMLMEVTE